MNVNDNDNENGNGNGNENENEKTMVTRKRIIAIGGSLVMLLSTLLPLVNVKSYRWNIFDLPHKIDRLVENTTYNTVGKVLIAALVLFPLVLALVTWLKGRAPKLVAVLPVVVALAFIVILFLSGRPTPGVGLWLYAAVAAATFAMTFKH